MAELLLEILSEDIPARMQARAAEDLKRLVCDGLTAAGLAFDRAEAHSTPRRLALVVDGLPARQPDLREERKGPRVGAPEQAIAGFLRGAGLESLDQAVQRDTGKGVFWFAVVERPGRPTAEVLPAILGDSILQLPWPKSMRWAGAAFRWVRPMHSILALFDGKVLDGAFDPGHAGANGEVRPARVVARAEAEGLPGAIPFGDTTVGHRFLAPEPFAVRGFEDYRAKLREAHVILDREERKGVIRTRAERVAADEGLTLRPDELLLEEVTGLVEWPVVLVGSIDRAFMDVPHEVLTTSMRTHQKYFALLGPDGRLAPRFVVVANMPTADGGEAVVRGNERVLRARLSDAKFFWDQDRKTRLEERVPALASVTFHARLGTMADKVSRMQTLAAELAEHVPHADVDEARSAARLAKADLVSGMVGEFPELQGVMGRYYALHEGEMPAVADAIAEHYRPLGPTDACPTAPTSVCVALADKIDTLVGFFAIDERPTGSKDPFALRRAALGAIRLIVENRLRLPLRPVLTAAHKGFAAAGLAKGAEAVAGELLDFFADRLEVVLRDRGVRHDLVDAVFALGGEDDLVRLLARVAALRSFLGSEDGANLLTAYRRASNIVRIEEKKDRRGYDEAPEAELLVEPEEKALFQALAEAERAAIPLLAREDFEGCMAALARLRGPVDAFFDRVTVNADDPALRANRLRLLSQIRSTLNQVADFSRIEG